jgi:hypothetical protein
MTEQETETTTAGSVGIPQRETGEVFGKPLQREERLAAELRNEGIAGLSCDVSKRDHEPSGAACAGQENEELEWARRHMPEEPVSSGKSPAGPEDRQEPAGEVFRKTELHNAPPVPDENELRKLRSRMMKRLKRRDPEIQYLQFETSFREFICSLLVRQYREENELREQIAALWEQARILDDRLERKLDRFERRLDELEEQGRY